MGVIWLIAAWVVGSLALGCVVGWLGLQQHELKDAWRARMNNQDSSEKSSLAMAQDLESENP
jgi:hypothetical protein